MKTGKRVRSLLSIVLAALLLASFALPASASATDLADEIVRLVNAERAAQNLPALQTTNAGLHAAAKVRADECVAKFDIVEHKRPDGRIWYTVLKEHGVTHYSVAGETLAAGYDTAADIVAAWMNNTQDRTNILHPDFTHVGVGVYEGAFTLGDDPQNGYIVALQFIAESKDRHPNADNAVQAILRRIYNFVVTYWNGGIGRIIDLFRFD